MNVQKLEKNIWDLIVEEQVKLGYRKELLRLYYPLSSLCHLLEVDCDEAQMNMVMQEFSEATKEHLGGLKATSKDARFCLEIPPKGMEYVHLHSNENDFLVQFIRTISRHECSLQDVENVFAQASDHVHEEPYEGEDFDYLFYFEDGVPNDYRYCITFEGCHVIYHRFTPEDYKDFGF